MFQVYYIYKNQQQQLYGENYITLQTNKTGTESMENQIL